jgi:hypothetical protein
MQLNMPSYKYYESLITIIRYPVIDSGKYKSNAWIGFLNYQCVRITYMYMHVTCMCIAENITVKTR